MRVQFGVCVLLLSAALFAHPAAAEIEVARLVQPAQPTGQSLHGASHCKTVRHYCEANYFGFKVHTCVEDAGCRAEARPVILKRICERRLDYCSQRRTEGTRVHRRCMSRAGC